MFRKFQQEETRNRTILIVEDDVLIAFDNEHVLREAGFTVAAAVDNMTDALHLIARGGIDFVISDIRLRGEGSGMEVAHAARKAGAALLFVSGDCPEEAREVAAGFLAKPYRPHDLLAAIRAIAARQAGRAPVSLPRTLTLFGD
ncbi:response regulator [Sphingomonas sp. PR090111-T3T-6A]|uniref:response regulator n=1 Tax=Sphingomonas sp. PR090111-T3T-6A TaxID=685778 RepID=UPI000375F9BE